MKAFYKFLAELNETAPEHMNFSTHGGNVSRYYQTISIYLHDYSIGEIEIRESYYSRNSLNYEFVLKIWMGKRDYYSMRTKEFKGWNYQTKGAAIKLIENTEVMFEESRKAAADMYHDKAWRDITLRDLRSIVPGAGGSAVKFYDNSGVRFTFLCPSGLNRTKFPRVYLMKLNDQFLFGKDSVTIDDPRVLKLVKELNVFDKKINRVLHEA